MLKTELPISANATPRVALFADTFYEPNGVATLCRHLTEFAHGCQYPFLLVRGGQQTRFTQDGSLETLELKRSGASFRVDKTLYCDPLLPRYKQLAVEHLQRFKPDVVHITGPGDAGFLGLWAAHSLRIPVVASWHTNLHEYLQRRLDGALFFLPRAWRDRPTGFVERQSLRWLLRFYQIAQFAMAPNQMLVDLLEERTGKPAFLMAHGVDLAAFRPSTIASEPNRPFCIGYVGRLTVEKNIGLLAEIDRSLSAAGGQTHHFLIVGDGGQQQWLAKRLTNAEFAGVLRGEELAAAYRRMDVLVFPSLTDTFGLVLLEAMASGVPIVVWPAVGQRVGIEDGVAGFLSRDFAASVQCLMHKPALRFAMAEAAHQMATTHGWDVVFADLYRRYAQGLLTKTALDFASSRIVSV